jgi:hypothetical protein
MILEENAICVSNRAAHHARYDDVVGVVAQD